MEVVHHKALWHGLLNEIREGCTKSSKYGRWGVFALIERVLIEGWVVGHNEMDIFSYLHFSRLTLTRHVKNKVSIGYTMV